MSPDYKEFVKSVTYEARRSYVTMAISDGTILAGSLPDSKMKLVQAWMEIHRDDLLADWKLAVNGAPVFKIDPLK